MKRAAIFFAVFAVVSVWSSCGGSSNKSSTTSGFKDRLLFDNTVSGSANLLNIDTNPPTPDPTPVATLSTPMQMYEAPKRAYVLIYDDATFTLSFFDTAQEAVTNTLSLNYHTEGVVLSSDGKTAYVAIPNNPEFNTPPGVVLTFDLTTGNSGAQIPIPGARRLVISGDDKSLLVFADNDNHVYYVDLTAAAFSPVAIAGFNNPYTAYFSGDNSTAYVLNCGNECSGSTAPSVQPVAISTTAQTLGTPIAVPGATVGSLSGTTLYVAGNDLTQPAGSQGVVSTVDLSAGVLKSSTAIADGLHNRIAVFNSKLWIGSWSCSTNTCLSIFDTSSNTAKIGNTTGNVTGIAPAPVSKTVYVMQGGELYQYDPNSLSSTMPFDIVGQGWDVKLLDQ